MITIRCLVEDTASQGDDFHAEHGVSWHIETPHGQVLFDTGQSGDVLLHNAELLGVDLRRVDALVLSHAHYDHTGGLIPVLDRMQSRPPLYASVDLFRPRYRTADPVPHFVGIALSREELERRTTLRLSTTPAEVLPGVWSTGEITDRYTFVGGSDELIVPDGDGWAPDRYLDDLSMVVQTAQGLVVLLGCGHAGLLNILRHVKRHFDGPIVVVAGGTHLMSATPEMLAQAVRELPALYDGPQLYPNHCTGQRAFNALAEAFGARVQPCPAGTVLTFDAP